MKSIQKVFFLLFVTGISALSQSFEVHSRGMLRQAVYDDGTLGRPVDAGKTPALLTKPSFEWPSNYGYPIYLDVQAKTSYPGFYNSFGGGFYIAADTAKLIPSMGKTSPRVWVECGGFTDASGNNTPGNSIPISITKLPPNYPVLPNGQINSAYDPNEAEEVIVAHWETPLGITVTRTSRAWSFPDYDDFIIYDYYLENTGNNSITGRIDTLRAMTVAFVYNFCNSMIAGMLENNNTWAELPFRDDKAGAKGFQYARYNWTRWLMYNHTINGMPYVAPNGNGDSILTAPGAVGMLPLYFDQGNLAEKSEVTVALASNWVARDSVRLWEINTVSGKKTLKQPYCVSWDNGNLNMDKFVKKLDIEQSRQATPFGSSSDSAAVGPYWIGRGRATWNNSLRNPTGKWYGFGPYTFLPHASMHFVVAEVAGFGPGSAYDKNHFQDIGGGTGSNTPQEPSPGVHPVASWYDTSWYYYLNDQVRWANPDDGYGMMGSRYMQTHALPDYVNSNTTITLRDVADRAIQMYTGNALIKYDTVQFKPDSINQPPMMHHFENIPIPCPAPAILVQNTFASSNRIVWGPQVETFAIAPPARVSAPFSYYQLMSANNPVGPWTLLDSIGKHDPRYFQDTAGLGDILPLTLGDSAYVYLDKTSNIGSGYFYAVVTVDSLGGKSGKTNLVFHNTQSPARVPLGKVYAAPNPFVITSHASGTSINGNIGNVIGFYGLSAHCTIRIFSYSGQLVQTIQHDADEFSTEWFQISRNNQWISSGVYYFVVEDNSTGARSWNKFVIIH
jgi:hypothetical protein